MEDLQEEGAVSSFFRQEGVGRPSKFYRLTPEGRERFPRRYELAAEGLIGALVYQGGREHLEGTMAEAGKRLAARFQDRIPADAPLEERVDALVELLKDLGFPTQLEVHEDRLVVVRQDCIFLKLAREHRDAVCGQLDTTLLSELLGTDVELSRCIPDGARSCAHSISRT